MPRGIYTRTDEHKKRISDIQLGRKLSPETKAKISCAKLGKNNKPVFFKTCSVCGVAFEVKSWKLKWNKGKYCSRECSCKVTNRKGLKRKNTDKMSLAKMGEKNPSWKGGITPVNTKIRNSIENRLWREAVFARDNWICQCCGIKGGELHAHHIKLFCDYPELRFAIDNGKTLCKLCHRKVHSNGDKINHHKEEAKPRK